MVEYMIGQVNIAHVGIEEVDDAKPVKCYNGYFPFLPIVHLPAIFDPLGFFACIG